jgi:hypothetical protein
MVFATSPSSGNRPTDRFEKTNSPSTITSKTPFEPSIRRVVDPNSRSSSAASPAARGS